MTDELEFYTVDPAARPRERRDIVQLLAKCGLGYEAHIEIFVVCRQAGRLLACAGLERDIVKCVAIEPDCRGGSLSLTLLSEVEHLAYERGHSHLFLYTRPENASFFQGSGFYPLVEVPEYVTLMENTPIGIKGYCDRLRTKRVPGAKIGAVVINANPFTLGHQFLIELAARECDWLHVFVISEDASFITYADRYALVESGVQHIPKMTLHHGSEYMISRATFPCYFFKEQGCVGDCCTGIDLLLFRNYIAPALGVNRRYVGTEPFCETTRKYNEDMKHWLQAATSAAPVIDVIEEMRSAWNGVPISASEVRHLLHTGDLEHVRMLVPAATYDLLMKKYVPRTTPFDPKPGPDDMPRPTMAFGI